MVDWCEIKDVKKENGLIRCKLRRKAIDVL